MCAFLVFFFFKQKTAYEMRISDWSSDVCSSDLDCVSGYRWGTDALRYLEAGERRERSHVGLRGESPSDRRLTRRPGLVAQQAPHAVGQIGRASCRERVCQYV